MLAARLQASRKLAGGVLQASNSNLSVCQVFIYNVKSSGAHSKVSLREQRPTVYYRNITDFLS